MSYPTSVFDSINWVIYQLSAPMGQQDNTMLLIYTGTIENKGQGWKETT